MDIFEIDNNTFATVLELVEGGDLDAYCKLHEVRAALLLCMLCCACLLCCCCAVLCRTCCRLYYAVLRNPG